MEFIREPCLFQLGKEFKMERFDEMKEGFESVQMDHPFSEPEDDKSVSARKGETESATEPEKAPEKSEEEKRAAHEAAEAKRKAEWDARRQAEKDALQAELDRLESMTADELAKESIKRVGMDTEKITRRNMKESVTEYIQTLCMEDVDFAKLAMHPKKNMLHCFQYINRKAWDYVQDEMKANNIKPGREVLAYSADIPDGLCYQWAEDYFRDPDAKEDEEKEEEFIPRPYIDSTRNRRTVGKGKKNAVKEVKKPVEKKQPEKTAKPQDDGGQLSLFGALATGCETGAGVLGS